MPRHAVHTAALLTFLLVPVKLGLAADGIIDAEAAFDQLQAGELTVIDIRRPEEWAATGIPAGGKAITMHDPDGHAAFLEKVLAGVDGDRGAPVGLICASGVRSTWASSFLARHGFSNVVNIRGGMLGRGQAPGWIRRSLPTEEAGD